ncbi:MAG: CHAT domain-containing protein, partial [Acidimicrobiia bacterium]
IGDFGGAMDAYASALPLFEEAGDQESIAMTLSNRGLLELGRLDLDNAKQDLEEALRIDTELGNEVESAAGNHNLGAVAAKRGDLPEALARFNESEMLLIELLGSADEVQVATCEALLASGLFREALSLAERLIRSLSERGLAEERAEAMLIASRAALASGDNIKARSWAESAASAFGEQGRETWRQSADLVALQARHAGGESTPGLREKAVAAADVLMRENQVVAGRSALLLAGRIALESDDVEDAREYLSQLVAVPARSIEIQIESLLAQSLLALADDDEVGARLAARTGLELLASHQETVGATDMRVALERHGAELGQIGLGLALEAQDPDRVLEWAEMTRAQALLTKPVTPPDDAAQERALAQLRDVHRRLRTATGETATSLMERQEELQSEIQIRSRSVEGDKGREGFRHGAIEPLDATTLVEFVRHGDQLSAVVLSFAQDARLVPLADTTSVLRELESLRFSMRRLARGGSNREVATRTAARLEQLIIEPLGINTDRVVFVPTPELYAAPWRLFPSTRQLVTTVSPSGAAWRRAKANARPIGNRLLAVAGPDLELADEEASAVAAAYAEADLLDSNSSVVADVSKGLARAQIAHFASHAHFEFENPMFSALRLADGALYLYDIERLGQTPDVVILSACDSGYTDAHVGEELMGLTSTLLAMGTNTIIASVGLVPDSDETKELMIRLHDGLSAGVSPSEALVIAQTSLGDSTAAMVAASSFVCIGAG